MRLLCSGVMLRRNSGCLVTANLGHQQTLYLTALVRQKPTAYGTGSFGEIDRRLGQPA